MKLHKDEGPPCVHMESLLNRLADGTLRGWKKWYTVYHATHCDRCGTFLDRLKLTLSALRNQSGGTPPQESLDRLRNQIHTIAAKQNEE